MTLSMRGVALLVPLWAVSCAEGETIGSGGSGGESSTSNGGSGGRPTSVTVGSGASGGTGATGGSTTTGGVGGVGGSGGQGGEPDKCGNMMLDAGEDCDGTDLNSKTCATIGQGFIGGTLGCAACTFDVSQCTSPPNCGNGLLNAGEECDGQLLGGSTCQTEGFTSGTLTCSSGCTLNKAGCYTCGNPTIEGPEVCDGSNLAGQNCTLRGHDGGNLACASNCLSFNEVACTDCGDGLIEGSEQCDGQNFGGATCQSLGFPGGGALTCSGTCQISTAQCSAVVCGNNVREGLEVCDGTALNGQTCASQGFGGGGTLSCQPGCMAFNTSQCTGSQCSDSADNDVDGFTDLTDPGCTNAADNSESIFAASCNGVGGPIYDVTFANQALDITVTGTTTGAPNAFGPTDTTDDCTTATGGEVVLMWRNLSFKSSVTFSLDNPGTNFDSVLYIRQTNCASGVEFCNDDVAFLALTSEVGLINVPAGDYYIFIDGYGGQSGNYELTIDLP